MEIREILEERPWEEFLTRQPHTPFLQSWAWGEFQDKLGISHHRFGIYQGGALEGICQALVGRRRLGSFVYVPHGPVLESFDSRAEKTVLSYLRDFAKKEGVDYLRVEPRWEDKEENRQLLKEAGFRPATSSTQARVGWLLDLSPSEEELLAQMRKTTRYLIRKAGELGVVIHRTRDIQDLEKFHRLMNLTTQRQGFTPQSRSYLQKQFETLAPLGMTDLYFAEHEGNILAGALITLYGDTASYVHAASSHSDIPAAYALIWEAIRNTKKSGMNIFDFWGIAESDDLRHPWYGLSLFKKGFGGYRVDYTGAWDLPLSARYLPVMGVERVRKLIRGH